MATLSNSRSLRVEWRDCDPAGIVFYPRYFAMFDTSTTTLFEKATGMTAAQLYEHYDVIGYALVDVRARFLIPVAFRDDITIETHISAFRRSSFDVQHRVFKAGELAVEATETRVWAGKHPDDPAKLKARPLPEAIVARFSV